MRNLFFILLAFLITQNAIAKNEQTNAINDNDNKWEAVKVIDDETNLDEFVAGEQLEVSLKKTGLRVFAKRNEEKEAIVKLKKLALEKGYSAVKIEKIRNRLKGIPKKKYRLVEISATGYSQKN